MIRILGAAALAAFAMPAIAQTHVFETHTDAGIAGRSPHKAYRQIAAQPACGTAMHSLPGGKLPHYGVRQSVACDAAIAERAAAEPAIAAAN